jgi:hypothetical protein
MESATGNPRPYVNTLCHMLVKSVFGIFAHRGAKPETMRLSPVTNHRLRVFQPSAMKISKDLQRLRYRRLQCAANRMACGARPTRVEYS